MKYHQLGLSILALCLALFSCNRSIQKTQPTLQDGTKDFKVVGYLGAGNLDQIDQIELSLLTHLDLAFANPDENGKLIFRGEQDLTKVVHKAHQAGVKVYLSIAGGGINEALAGYWLAVLQPKNRPAFIQEMIDFVLKYQLDGIDVDIEWNLLPTIGDLYTPFVLELKEALRGEGKGISSALNVSGLHESVSQEALKAYDFINVMVYDKTGPWRPDNPGPHAPYSYAEEALKYWTEERKIPAEKLTLGVPFYGYDFDSVKSISYQKLVQRDPANAYRDEVGAIYYNGIPTIIKKTRLAMKSFGGIMIWELTQDARNELSLLKAIDQTYKAAPK
ncbi:MAG: chitinase [Saprospiraceae bacterium]|nr:MAG: chitinase [Saprospiraceae bacterium]